MNPKQAQVRVAELISEVKNHPTCLRLEDCDGKYRVYHPQGFRYDATQSSYSEGKIIALERLLASIEKTWIAGGIHTV
jgi:hypothetical protein